MSWFEGQKTPVAEENEAQFEPERRARLSIGVTVFGR
jgi:hypothetical protein